MLQCSDIFKDLVTNLNNRAARFPGLEFEEMETLIIGLRDFAYILGQAINTIIVLTYIQGLCH